MKINTEVSFGGDPKSEILLAVFCIIVSVSLVVTYCKFFIFKDYTMRVQADCDPQTEACFVHVCNPDAEECTGDTLKDTSYYKIIDRNAGNIPLCNPSEENCLALTCPVGEQGCSIIVCNETTLAETDGDTCNDPQAYQEEHPQSETGTGE